MNCDQTIHETQRDEPLERASNTFTLASSRRPGRGYPNQAKIETGSVIDGIRFDARAEAPRRTRNFAKLAKFEANETRSVPNAKTAPTIRLWASQNGAPTRNRPFIREVEVCNRARLPNELPVSARADGMPCHVTTERKTNKMKLAP